MKKLVLFFSLILSFSILNAKYIKIENNEFITYKIDAKYSNILFALEDEIAQNGFIISYRAKIARALKKIDSHYKQEAIFRKAQKIGFCRLSLTLEMMSENPDNLMYCPLSIAIYEKKNEKNKITIIYRLAKNLSSKEKIMTKVNKEVIAIIEAAIE